MGFKRTSEGRIYFKGADEPESAAKPIDYRALSQSAPTNGARDREPSRPQQDSPASVGGQAMQFQILSLLKSLNDKLKDSQTDRQRMRLELDAYKKVIEDLGGKANKGEKAFADLEQKISKGGKGTDVRAERAEKLAEETAKELHETRKLLLDLEDRADKNDKAAQSLERRLAQTKTLGDEIARTQINYDELIKRIDESETRHEDLSKKLEDTNSQQSKMLRQIEKVAEDRQRFMRKIERIEETVIQTRDALSSKAMVLLTDQGAVGRVSASSEDASAISLSPAHQLRETAPREPWKMPAFLQTLWRKPAALQAAGVAGILAFGILAGWAVNQILIERQSTLESFKTDKPEQTSAIDSAQTSALNAVAAATPAEDKPQDEPAAGITQQPDNGQFSATSAPAPSSSPLAGPFPAQNPPAVKTADATDDIGAVDVNDPKKLAAMLDKSPDGVAAALNKIEPQDAGAAPSDKDANANSSVEPASLEAKVDVPPPPAKQAVAAPAPQTSQLAPQAAPPKPVVAASEPITSPLEPAMTKDQLAKAMRPDSSLPPAAQDIETQAFNGVPEAQHDLAAIYTAGQGGVHQDYTKAAFWFRQAADQGIANARYNLGVLYHQGLGVKPDVKEAIRWYQSAASLGHPEAEYNLGIAYIEGLGVGYDPAKASDNFERAAKQGIKEAAYNLGLIYENGLLGKPEPDKALRWYKSAADAGSPEAKEALAELAKTLNIKVEDVNRVADSQQR